MLRKTPKASPQSNHAIKEMVNRLYQDPESSFKNLNKIKLEVSKKYALNCIPSNSQILEFIPDSKKEIMTSKLTIKKVRSISGIQIVAVMSKPHDCPHGKCCYCPSYLGVPQSYTGHEPSSMRGLQNRYDPYQQVSSRLNQLKSIGHDPSKVELIVQGGTFPATSLKYQEWFIRRCIDALTKGWSSSIEEAKSAAEESKIRNVGITVETRPDQCGQKKIDFMLKLGVTRVEVGIQTLYDEIYEAVERGHTVSDVKKAFKTARDSGLKIVAHMMVGLPGMTPDKDLQAFKSLFNEDSFRPDMLKIYPCLVLKNSKLYRNWLKGDYQPYDLDQTVELISEIKKIVPPWIRIMRVQRDIPAWMIIDGVKKGNLRELALKKLKSQGTLCHCIRCREVGHRVYKDALEINDQELELHVTRYPASDGEESFISIIHPSTDTLIGFLRMRNPSVDARRPEVKNSTLIRELHVLGFAAPVGKKIEGGYQHRGYGKDLLEEAERISSNEYGVKEILVTSGLGVRVYYRKLGYELMGPYMGKRLIRNQY